MGEAHGLGARDFGFEVLDCNTVGTGCRVFVHIRAKPVAGAKSMSPKGGMGCEGGSGSIGDFEACFRGTFELRPAVQLLETSQRRLPPRILMLHSGVRSKPYATWPCRGSSAAPHRAW